MGLDITAYSRLVAVGKHTDGWCGEDSHVQAYAYDCFPASFRGITVLGTEQGTSATFLVGGCYEITDAAREYDFRAGSYSGYNAWRSDLAAQFNPDAGPDQGHDLPFYELIWFADNEGSIGPEAAADLLADFERHADQYRPSQYEDYFREKYAAWTEAFRLAADGGLVSFH